ncbi:MAG: aldehyde dehydrogenase family protein, partial [Bdellovibrionales bacterium]|nr:aldehyde dehydrogenase family protein [Bdellovibrionales bacterium]
MNKFNFLVDGARSTGKFVDIKSPFDGEVVGQVEQCDETTLEKALSNASHSFEAAMKEMPAYKRAEILYKVAELIHQNHEELALTIAQEGGKPLKDARVEVSRAINTTKMCGDEALLLGGGETISMDRAPGSENQLAFTMRLPVGPVLCISAFNHPLNLACHQICPAIAAGNSVVFKPASQTPISALKLASYFAEAGLPQGALNLVVCKGSQAEQLLQDARIRFVSFIGSAAVGWTIPKQVAPGVRYALEHGGTAPAIVHHDADLLQAVPSLTKGAFYHAGQVCVSTQLIYAHELIFDQLLEQLRASAQQLKTGDPTDPDTDVGPIISKADLKRIEQSVQEAVQKGARAIIGARCLSASLYAPTILVDTDASMSVVNEEI